MRTPNRRSVLLAASLAAAPVLARAADETISESAIAEALTRYDGFGIKASGGPGDIACGAWVEGELRAAGLTTRRQAFDIPFATLTRSSLTCGAATAEVIAQAVVRPTPPEGLTAKLVVFDPAWSSAAACKDAIALIILPYRRWSAAAGEPKAAVDAVMAAGAMAAVLITTGPTGEACALNVPNAAGWWDRPVAILAPKQAAPFLKAAATSQTARLDLTGTSGRRSAFNVIGILARGKAKTLVLSTPRSGWFTCTGERGSGLAAWLELVRWTARSQTGVNIAVIATSGHEYDYAGGEAFIRELAPRPADVALWTHLGANVATRDWAEQGANLLPLPSADPQRTLAASPDLLDACRAAFSGQPGIEAPREFNASVAGELASIRTAGYTRVMGIFGSHRFHHTRADNLRCTSPALARQAATSFQTVITQALRTV